VIQLRKAWQQELEIRRYARPKRKEPSWGGIDEFRAFEDLVVKLLWHSEVPGSGSQECLMRGAVQAACNKGLEVSKAEVLLPVGLQALTEGETTALHKVTSTIWRELNAAPPDPGSSYWNFTNPTCWEEHQAKVNFPDAVSIDVSKADFERRILGGWVAQICGGAFGTALEGYTTDRIIEAFGEIKHYVREPSTLNDDITYELAFLKAFEEKGYFVQSRHIAEQWIALIPFGWSAEYVALQNLKLGIYPPESGTRSNPFSEWIGAQMRGAVVGMVAPGDPMTAARLAWVDGVISHQANGVLGEVFNASMIAMAFIERDVRKILIDAINLLPHDSQYYTVVAKTLALCRNEKHWLDAWRKCEQRLERYNWIHAYPNAAIEVIALWYGSGDFDKTMSITAIAGQDVDCNAAQIATVLGVMFGPDAVGKCWTDPIHDDLRTYVRGMEELKITELAQWTTELVRRYWPPNRTQLAQPILYE